MLPKRVRNMRNVVLVPEQIKVADSRMAQSARFPTDSPHSHAPKARGNVDWRKTIQQSASACEIVRNCAGEFP
jgi:hypothetical protein